MITAEDAALLRACAAWPRDEAALDRYATWLEAHDPQRARWLAKRRVGKLSLNELFAEMAAWKEALGITREAIEMDVDPVPRRLKLHAHAIAELGPLFEALPFLMIDLTFSYAGQSAASIAETFAWPAVAKIRGLSFDARILEQDPDENYQSLLSTPYGAVVLEHLCASPNVRELERLWIGKHEIGPRCATLIAAGRFERLRGLSIIDEKLGDEGAIALAEGPACATIESLNLLGCAVGPDGIAALRASKTMTSLKSLRIDGRNV